jgi:hypothetical protein
MSSRSHTAKFDGVSELAEGNAVTGIEPGLAGIAIRIAKPTPTAKKVRGSNGMH